MGKYRILEPLGRGGMAQVYKAYHPQLERYAAVKVLRSDLVEEEEFLARFRREAQAVAALRHANIVQVFDFDVERDVYYMVMELLEGDTLKARINDYRLRSEQMPLGEMVRILLDVLDGLAYAHHEGMIHRDIKPANIMLTKRGQAILADFGIAKMVGGTRHTASGALMGTLNYIAPEQGLKGESDARSDIYSLGIVFYEMLTKRTPFDADTPLAILMKHLNDPLPLPHQIDQSVPEPFERVVLKALAKDPADRYQSAEEMAQALRKAAIEAGLELPDRISLPLSFTTVAAPSESVAVLSGTARGKIADAQFAADDTDANLSQKLAAGQAPTDDNLKELVDAAGALGQEFAGKAARALRQAASSVDGKPGESAPSEPAGDNMQELAIAMNVLGQAVAGKTAQALRQATAELKDKSAPAPEAQPTGEKIETAPAAEMPAPVGSNKADGRVIVSALAFAIIVFSVQVLIAGVTDNEKILTLGWPTAVLLTGFFLSAIMAATATFGMIIPVSIVSGTAMLLAYFSLNHWRPWPLWLLEPMFVFIPIVAVVWFNDFAQKHPWISRGIGLVSAVINLVAVAMVLDTVIVHMAG
jgi:serine/threonine-protein kinase